MKINTNIQIDPTRYAAIAHTTPPSMTGGREAMGGAALCISESPFGGEEKVSSAVEASLDRNDSIGRLFQQAFSYPPPALPAMVAED